MVSEFIKSVKVKQGSDADCYVKYGLAPLEMPKNIRIKILKTGSLHIKTDSIKNGVNTHF